MPSHDDSAQVAIALVENCELNLSVRPLFHSGPSVRNYNYYSAPPLVGGYGGYGYGYGGGISIFPSFGVPLFYGGGIFNILIFMVRILLT